MNKFTISIAALLFLATIAQAQTTEPVFSKQSSWSIITTSVFFPTYKIDTYKVAGDTLIGEVNYSKLLCNDQYFAALRETEDHKIYAYTSHPYVEAVMLIYDFDWYPGKELYYDDEHGYTLGTNPHLLIVLGSSIDSMQLLDGRYYQYVNIGNQRIIRGIGDTHGFFISTFYLPNDGSQYRLLCFYIDDKLVYSNPDYNYCIEAVTEITNVPTTAMAGIPLALSGTVVPNDATFQEIVWSVYDIGTTGATITEGILNATTEGVVVVTATVKNGIAVDTAYTQNFTIEVQAVGINESAQELPNIKVYPNPSSHSVTVEFLRELEVETFKIFDMKGSLIKVYEIIDKDTIEVQNLAKGTYVYVALLKNSQKLSGKIIIQ